MIKYLMVLFLLVVLVPSVHAITIDVYYPDNISTTEFFYSVGSEYNTTTTNNITGDFQTVILKNDIVYDNVIESPHLIVSPMFKLVLICILIIIFIIGIYYFKKII